MAESGGSPDEVRGDADKAVAGLIATLAAAAVEENKWCAVRVHTAYDILDARLGGEAGLGELDPKAACRVRAARAAETEVQVALDVSTVVARTIIDIGEALYHRFPLVDTDFTDGLLTLSTVRTVVTVLARASVGTVMAIEPEVLAAARQLTPKRLKNRIRALWRDHDPEEFDAAQAQADADEQKVYSRSTDDGGRELIARLGACSIAEAELALDDLVGTVCAKDPRTKRQLRCAAFTAIVRRYTALECLCGRDDECPVYGAVDANPRDPAVVLNVHADLETLLGVLSDRPHLADGTPLDADTAHWVLTNARIRGVLIELLDLARQNTENTGAENGTDECAGTESGAETDTAADPDAHNDTEAGRDDTVGDDVAGQPNGDDSISGDPTDEQSPADADAVCAAPCCRRDWATRARRGNGVSRPEPCVPDHASRTRPRTTIRRAVRRTRLRKGFGTPPPHPWTLGPGHRRAPRLSTRERDTAAHIRTLLGTIAADPTVADGVDPTGHGGLHLPTAAALIYRPSPELAACVRAMYPYCVFPGCTVPADACELDHNVPFDHDNPLPGGWTVLGNLAPLCPNHHRAKTEQSWTLTVLDRGFICWRTRSGLIRITAPDITTGYLDTTTDEIGDQPLAPPRRTEPPLPDDLTRPTPWEQHLLRNHTSPDNPPVTSLTTIARTTRPDHKRTATDHHQIYLHHQRIARARDAAAPPPF